MNFIDRGLPLNLTEEEKALFVTYEKEIGKKISNIYVTRFGRTPVDKDWNKIVELVLVFDDSDAISEDDCWDHEFKWHEMFEVDDNTIMQVLPNISRFENSLKHRQGFVEFLIREGKWVV